MPDEQNGEVVFNGGACRAIDESVEVSHSPSRRLSLLLKPSGPRRDEPQICLFRNGGVPFPANLQVTLDLAEAIANAAEVLIVVPSHAFASVCEQLARLDPDLPSLAWATKGFDPASKSLLSEVAARHLPRADLES